MQIMYLMTSWAYKVSVLNFMPLQRLPLNYAMIANNMLRSQQQCYKIKLLGCALAVKYTY